MAGLLDQIKAQVDALPPDQVRAQLMKMQEQKAKQTERNKERNQDPEVKAKRTLYNQERSKNPEVVAKRKEYHQKPEVKARMTEYRKERAEKQKMILAKAKELGLIDANGNVVTA
jgi:hypothetical protein